MSIDRYKEKLKNLSDRLVAIQKPILILDSIKWPIQQQENFINGRGRRLPDINQDYYDRLTPGFNPEVKQQELSELYHQVNSQLGKQDHLGKILKQTIRQYQMVIELLQHRGTSKFGVHSKQLYGSATDHLRGDRKTLIELGERLCSIFSLPAAAHLSYSCPKDIKADDAVRMLDERLNGYFSSSSFNVQLSDGIVSDASAGGDCIKINTNSFFSSLDLQVLEVHEGWVHVGTTLNGRMQNWASWLSVGSPRITATQEGLAVLIETLTFNSYPGRARRISDRVVAIGMAEQGADFYEVYNYFCEKGLTEKESYVIAQRVFRGGNVRGGSYFTKDLSYVRGFVETVNFIKSAILSDVPQLLPMLFVGKVTLDDIPILYEYMNEGVISPPKYLPSMFRDLNGLYTWFGFSSGMSLINLGRVQNHFEKMFAELRDSLSNRNN
ncbi:MAG: flavohemoglobin expression-modulating QEGLA motif protein [Gammaproteobacteria bacterium]|nr:flavohemoglobin expression-modulating QEGLA motif protein [Gammaproteobacteria bacterium]MCW9056770.1 flavohemoglobin expression-modulating QEGLA motif protein [Gammaproteobacteria bacterium]